jgi:hypothetical protein
VTAGALAGVACSNALYLVVGCAVLWGIGTYDSWGSVLRLAGLGYLVGVAVLGIVWTLAVVVAVPFGVATIVASAVAVSASSILWGHRRGNRLPRGGRQRIAAASLLAAAWIGLAGVFLEALFRAARLHGLFAFDAWVFWVPKGKALYYFGGLDEQFFTSLPGPTYPPLVPLLDAAAFHAMGGADTVTLHVQYWFLAVGFVAAVAGLLAPHVPSWLLWPSLLLVLVAPRLTDRLLDAQADFLVDYLFVAAAVAVALWLVARETWHLPVVTILLGGALLTKREGALLAACLLAAAFAVTVRERRRAWPGLAAVALVLVVVAVPWRLWYGTHGVGGEAPTDVGLGQGVDRLADALRLSLDVLFDTSLWSIVPAVGVAAIALALVAGSRLLGTLVALLLGLVVLGGAWITFSYAELPISADEATNPIVRYTGAPVLLCAALTPLLLAGVWTRPREDPR